MSEYELQLIVAGIVTLWCLYEVFIKPKYYVKDYTKHPGGLAVGGWKRKEKDRKEDPAAAD